MNGIEQLLTIARAFSALEQIPLSTVSSRVFDDGKKLRTLEDGAGIDIRRLERAMQWFSGNWPDAPWPSDIPRPAPIIAEPVEARA